MFQRAISVVTAGDRSKQRFEELMLPYLPALHRLASRLTGDSTAAEDLVQETYLKAFKAFSTLRDPERARSWIFRILSRVAIDHQRDRGREVLVQDPEKLDRFSLYDLIWDEDPLPYSDHPHEDFLAHFQDEEVRAALSALPHKYRVPLLLLYVEDMTYGELAEILECPLGTVMSRLHRGRKILERELWECAKRRGLVKAWKPNH
jgi:RNA polymerase sigma-70 factor (ECF subfamily)